MRPKVVLWHTDGLGTCRAFDVFLRKGVELDEEEKKIIGHLYDVECEIAEKFLERFPDYELVGSEDLLHIVEINNQIWADLDLLSRKDWQWVTASDLGLEEEKEEQ